MSWAIDSKVKILKFNAYTINAEYVTSSTLSQLIDEQMASIALNLPDLIPVIEADLATLDTLDAALTTEQGNTNATLIQADVLRWSDNRSKTSGISDRFEMIRSRIARMLSQAIESQSAGGWSGTLMRG